MYRSMKQDNPINRCDFRMHDVIDDKYRVERVLGGTLNEQKFKVIDTEGQEYILKLLKLWEIESRMQQAMSVRSESEIESCKIKSFYLTNISKSGYVKGNPYVLVPYMQTSDLSRLIKSPRLDVTHTSKQILYGLRDLHKSGKVHCALIPENILITKDNNVLLTNYIILGDRCKTMISTTKMPSNSRLVSKVNGYIAPEFFNLRKNATILPTSDIYSFGVVLFQMLTGELPFGQLHTEADWIRYQSRVMSGDWNKSLIQRGTNRNNWITILDGCLSATPNDRFENVEEILKLLPDAKDEYKAIEGAKVEGQKQIQHGILLNLMQGDEFGMKYRLPELFISGKRIITVGRNNDELFNTLELKEESSNYISRHHCTIEWDEEIDTWYIRDGQWEKDDAEPWHRSLNGTYVNSHEIDEEGCKILPGDIISIGDIKLRVEGY